MAKETKKGSIGKGILQFLIFFVLMGIGMVRCEKNILGLVLFAIALFWYCFVSYTDNNPFFDGENFKTNLKSRKRRIWFVVICFLRGRMMLGSYQGKGSEKIHNFQENTTNSMENFTDSLEELPTELADKAIQELEEMK